MAVGLDYSKSCVRECLLILQYFSSNNVNVAIMKIPVNSKWLIFLKGEQLRVVYGAEQNDRIWNGKCDEDDNES